MRANIDLLLHSEASGRTLPPSTRDELFTDLRLQLAELAHLTEELTVLAHDRPGPARTGIRLDHVATDAVERARAARITTTSSPTCARGLCPTPTCRSWNAPCSTCWTTPSSSPPSAP